MFCSFRAVWVLSEDGRVLLSRRYPTVERRWAHDLATQPLRSNEDPSFSWFCDTHSLTPLPGDQALVTALIHRLDTHKSDTATSPIPTTSATSATPATSPVAATSAQAGSSASPAAFSPLSSYIWCATGPGTPSFPFTHHLQHTGEAFPLTQPPAEDHNLSPPVKDHHHHHHHPHHHHSHHHHHHHHRHHHHEAASPPGPANIGPTGENNNGAAATRSHSQRKGPWVLWPLVVHRVQLGPEPEARLCVIVLPRVDPSHLAQYLGHLNPDATGENPEWMCTDESRSSLWTSLVCVSGAVEFAETLGTLCATSAHAPITHSWQTQPQHSPRLNTEVQEFLRTSAPFGSPLDFSAASYLALKASGKGNFPQGSVQSREVAPAWKPHLHGGSSAGSSRARLQFTLVETLSADLHHKHHPPRDTTVHATLICRADLDGVPDVTVPLVRPSTCQLTALAVHHCAQAPDNCEAPVIPLCFSPPLGSFELARFTPHWTAAWENSPTPLPITASLNYTITQQETTSEILFEVTVRAAENFTGVVEQCEVSVHFPPLAWRSLSTTPLGAPQWSKLHTSLGTAVTPSQHHGGSGEGRQGYPGGKPAHLIWKLPNTFTRRGRSEACCSGGVVFPVRVPPPADTGGPPSACNPPAAPLSTSSPINHHTATQEDSSRQQHEGEHLALNGFARLSYKVTGVSMTGVSVDKNQVVAYLAGQGAVKTTVEVANEIVTRNFVIWNKAGRPRDILKASELTMEDDSSTSR